MRAHSAAKKIFFYFIAISIYFYAIEVDATNVLNTSNAPPGPRTERLINYTINAKRAEIIKKTPSSYNLIIYDSFKVVTYSTSHDSESVNLDDFLDIWRRSGAANVESDVAGVQVNNLVFGHAQFYASVLLKRPRKIGNKVFFDLIPVSSLHMHKSHIFFDNVTLFINGCDICNCGTNDNINEKNCIVRGSNAAN